MIMTAFYQPLLLRFLLVFLLSVTLQLITNTAASDAVNEEVACFNTIFSISCTPSKLIVFESARYGRNDTLLATRCGVPYSRHCDIDVHFLMNRACAGRRKCTIMVNTALFGDPCGYEEFLRISYQCVPASSIHSTCFSAFSPTLYDHGYLSTPNYPDKYFMDADCSWKLLVQNHQTIRITIFDFELDLKRAGQCKDFLEIFSSSFHPNRSFFKDCGVLGKQTVDVNASSAVVRFVTGQSSLTQRGYFLYFEAVGVGCPNLLSLSSGVSIFQFIDDDVLSANVSCCDGMVFVGFDVSFILLRCIDTSWNYDIPDCIQIEVTESSPVHHLTLVSNRQTTTSQMESINSQSSSSSLSRSASVIGFALGVMSSILLVILLVLVTLYCYLKRRNHGNHVRNIDKWRVVINNLQDNATKLEPTTTYQHFPSTDESINSIFRGTQQQQQQHQQQHQQCRRNGCGGGPSSKTTSARKGQGFVKTPPAPPPPPPHQQHRDCRMMGRAVDSAENVLNTSSATSQHSRSGRPTWIEIPEECAECTCDVTAMNRRHHSQRIGEIPSVSINGILECRRNMTLYTGTMERSRQTISPCCSYWGSLRTYNKSATVDQSVPPKLQVSEIGLEPGNSPDFALSHSAPDLFTIDRHSGCVCFDQSETPTTDNDWLQENQITQSPLSTITKLSPLSATTKDSGVFSNVFRSND